MLSAADDGAIAKHPSTAETMSDDTDPNAANHADPTAPRRWSALDVDAQTGLQIAFGHWLDGLPPTCAMATKVARFKGWLRERGVIYDGPE